MMMLARSCTPTLRNTASRALSSTSFDGEMAQLYLRFFNQAADVWLQTCDVVADAKVQAGDAPLTKILDVASGPGEPGLTLARAHPVAEVVITDAAEAMVGMADARIAEAGLSARVRTKVMTLNDFTPVEDRPVDLVTAQFALMFTPDLQGSLREISSVLRSDGLLVGTVWEEFFILPLIKDTMTAVLGQPPPPPPINPLSLADATHVDAELARAGFSTLGRHNEKGTVEIELGSIDDDDTIKCCLIPVTPSLNDLQTGGKHGDDVFHTAITAMRKAAHDHGMVKDGNLVIKESTYRYFVAQKQGGAERRGSA